MTFLHPWMLPLILLLPLISLLLKRSLRLQADAAGKFRGPRSAMPRLSGVDRCRLAALCCIVLALARPAWNPQLSPRELQGRDLVIALDVSRSMLAQDVFPSRLDAARTMVFESLPQLTGQRLSLITFSGSAHVRVPLTLDHAFMEYRLKRASPTDADIGSTALQAPIEKAVDTVLPESEKGRQDLILFTDGEDHLSNLDDTAQQLAESGLRVLIIGLGDPVDGARIPDLEDPEKWMQYEGQDVITRLSEQPLQALADASPQITYFAAGTRPFDLMKVYLDTLQETAGITTTDDMQLIYTEGYPFLLALALLLGFFPVRRRTLAALIPALMVGCSSHPPPDDILYQEHMTAGQTAWSEVQSLPTQDPAMRLPDLQRARDHFLQAALLRSRDLPAAEHIAGISQQIRHLEEQLEQQRKEEESLQDTLKELTERLRLQVEEQQEQTQQSNQMLRRRPPVPQEEQQQAAPPAQQAQQNLNALTADIRNEFAGVQTIIRNMIKMMLPDEDSPATELDSVVELITTGTHHQTQVLPHIEPETLNWPGAHSEQQHALQKLKAALDELEAQNQGQDDSSDEGDEMDMEYDEDMEWSDSDSMASEALNASSMSTRSQLDARWQAAPNYSPADILAEEEANESARAEQQAKQAGARVEKNW